MLLSKFVVFIVENRDFFMCSRLSNVLSGFPRLVDPVVAVLSSVSSKVSSVAQAHWTSLAGEEVSGDLSFHWEYIKNQCRICWGMASACIQQVAQTFYRFMTCVSDKEEVMAAVAQNGWALEYASDGLRGDKEVVMAAVAQSGGALEYASAGLRVDPDVVIVARAARVHPFTG